MKPAVVRSAVAVVAWSLAAAPSARAASASWCGTRPAGLTAAAAAHAESLSRRRGAVRQSSLAGPADFDEGQIAVLIDSGNLMLASNLFDLASSGLVFSPSGDGYAVAPLDAAPLGDVGDALALGDDDTTAVDLPFAFRFFGREHTRVFVNSDGNLTFDAGDSASTSRDLGRLLDGPPRIAPLLADLNPEEGGRISASATADRLVVTWSEVPQYDDTDSNSFQVVLRADGRIEMTWSGVSSRIEEGVTGVAPGAGGAFTPVDLSAAAGEAAAGALGESFRADAELDLVATAQQFYGSHGDDFDQLVIFTSTSMIARGTFAFESTVRNDVQGIGARIQDDGAVFGSASRLSSVMMMDALSKYPADPQQVFLGTDDALDVLAHETGHRWLALARFRDGDRISDELLGRQLAHWSFFMDSDGSHMEGNDLQDLGGGQFRTVGASLRYSDLDLYLMGLLPAASVPPTFFVRTGDDSEEARGRDPQNGVTLTGVRRDVTIDAIVAAMGPRSPAPAPPPAPWRQVFVWVGVGGPPTALQLAQLERIRAAWEPRFAASTQGLWQVETRLR